MTETVHAEPTADAGPAEAVDTEDVVDLGADLEGPTVEPQAETPSDPTTAEQAPSSAEAAPGDQEQTPITQEQVEDLGTLSVDRLPKELQPFGQHILNLHRAKVSQLTERTRELEGQTQEQRLQALEAQGQQQQQTGTQEEADPLAELRATLPPAEQQALDTIGLVATKVADAKYGGQLTEMSTQVQQLTDVVQKLGMHIVQSAAAQAQQSVAEVRQQFPDIDQYQSQINALQTVQNPATGQNYTMAEAYQTITGKAAQISQQLTAEDAAVRRAPTTLTPTPAATVDADTDEGALTEAQLAAKIKAIGLTP